MPLFLYLMRHAQSVDIQPGFSDKERELTSNGIQETLLIGQYLLQEKKIPDLILSSTANRAKATAYLIFDSIKLTPKSMRLVEEFYNTSAQVFLEQITQLDDSLNTVMIVGHNPTISYLAEYLTRNKIESLPTAGLVIIQFKTDCWNEITDGTGELVRLVTPETL